MRRLLVVMGLFACEGPAGAPGETGATGPTGEQGEQGESGTNGEEGKSGNAGISTGSITGTVTDGETTLPISMASVATQPETLAASTSEDGTFAIDDLSIGVYTLVVSATGYGTQTVTSVSVIAGETTAVDVELFVPAATTGSVSGTVTIRSSTTTALADATVALVDAWALADSASDQPLEDLAATSPYTALTDDAGAYAIDGVTPGTYYVHVTPAEADVDGVLPGGDATRESISVTEAETVTQDIVVSQRPSPSATYLGSSTCLTCHTGAIASTDMTGWSKTPHALVYRVPGETTAIQDLSDLPEHDRALAYFKDSSIELTNERDNTGSGDEYGLRITQADFSKFPTTYNLWLGYDGQYFVEFEAPTGERSMRYYAVFTFGGHGLYKERWVTRVATDGSYAATAGGASSYYVLPFQYDEQLQTGVEPFHPYNASNWGPPSVDGGAATTPAKNKSFDSNCAGCHFTGISLTRDAENNFHADAADNADGALDYDGDGAPDEIDIGCEACHGPGSEHVAGGPGFGKNIVLPSLLSPERADQICGSCHTRGEGMGTIGGDHSEYPSSGTDILTFPYPGMSHAEFVDSYQEDNPGLYADDTGHSRQHHQQYIDYLKSTHYKNPYRRVTCGDCHNMHDRQNGPSLRASVEDNTLCLDCHAYWAFGLEETWTREEEAIAVSEHMRDYADMTVGYDPTNATGIAIETATGGVGRCTTCHMPKTAASQSRFMHESVDSNGQPSGARIRGDISSHVFDVVLPAQSEALFTAGGTNNQMPNSCGSCHNDDIAPDYTW